MIKSIPFKQMTVYKAVMFICIVDFEVASNSIYSRLLIAAVDNLWYFQPSAQCDHCGKYKDGYKIFFESIDWMDEKEENKKHSVSTKSSQRIDASMTNPKHGYI